jgi:hypothetical protein
MKSEGFFHFLQITIMLPSKVIVKNKDSEKEMGRKITKTCYKTTIDK